MPMVTVLQGFYGVMMIGSITVGTALMKTANLEVPALIQVYV